MLQISLAQSDAQHGPVLWQTGSTLQEALAAELDAAELLVTPSRPHPRELEYNDLTKLTYLNAVIKEAQRLHPTAPFGSNRCASQACPTNHLLKKVCFWAYGNFICSPSRQSAFRYTQ